MAPRKSVTVLGATGSIGDSTLDLIARAPEQFAVEALVGGRNAAKLADQAQRVAARMAVIADPAGYDELRDRLRGSGIECAAGENAVIEAADRPADLVMAAIVGAAGLAPTLTAIRRGATIALANKECLVCAGGLMMAEIAAHGARLLPVDSEHNAIFQVFDNNQRDQIERLILTASGGPFRTWDRAAMAVATPAQAVAHPNWSMGAKISVDSASMMNKGLELIEAFHIFGIPEHQIEVLVHPQSVIHSMVGYADGSVLAQLGVSDMRTPIAYCLGWPDRVPTPVRRLDFPALAQLTFEAPDLQRFPALGLARAALRSGGTAPAILNAANEVAVAAFLAGQIGFLDISQVVETVLTAQPAGPISDIAAILAADGEARRRAETVIAMFRSQSHDSAISTKGVA